MGQEHSAYTSRELRARHRDKEKHSSSSECGREQQPHKKRAPRHRSTSDLDFKSDNSSTESSGYRSSNSAYDYRSTSERSTASSEYYHLSIYKNDHYKEINRELYKPVKLTKDNRHRILIDVEKDKYPERNLSIKSYLSDSDGNLNAGMTDAKKSGIRNYTPKILSEEEQKKKIKNWI